MSKELRVKKYTCPDCGLTKSPTHHSSSCSGVVAYNFSKDRWECTKCERRMNGDTTCTNCGRKVNGYVKIVRRIVR